MGSQTHKWIITDKKKHRHPTTDEHDQTQPSRGNLGLNRQFVCSPTNRRAVKEGRKYTMTSAYSKYFAMHTVPSESSVRTVRLDAYHRLIMYYLLNVSKVIFSFLVFRRKIIYLYKLDILENHLNTFHMLLSM